MSYDRLNEEISKYRLAVFNPSAYVRPGIAISMKRGGRLPPLPKAAEALLDRHDEG
ncbi:MAG: hypothetical protein R2867_37110 [Caldilineaceae bacterium]